MYRIKVSYRTGNSFGSEDTYDILEMSWKDLEVAKDNLKRIEEHYRYYEYHSNSYLSKNDEPERPECYVGDPARYECTICLKADNNNDWQFWPAWCGYFETLYGAEIISEDEGLIFKTSRW